jgi:hypothetical protein
MGVWERLNMKTQGVIVFSMRTRWLTAKLGTLKSAFDAQLFEKVVQRLPDHPWPSGIHATIAHELDLPEGLVSTAITALIAAGRVKKPQADAAANGQT